MFYIYKPANKLGTTVFPSASNIEDSKHDIEMSRRSSIGSLNRKPSQQNKEPKDANVENESNKLIAKESDSRISDT